MPTNSRMSSHSCRHTPYNVDFQHAILDWWPTEATFQCLVHLNVSAGAVVFVHVLEHVWSYSWLRLAAAVLNAVPRGMYEIVSCRVLLVFWEAYRLFWIRSGH